MRQQRKVSNAHIERVYEFVEEFEKAHELDNIDAEVYVNKSSAVWLWKDENGRDMAALTVVPEQQEAQFRYFGMVSGKELQQGQFTADPLWA